MSEGKTITINVPDGNAENTLEISMPTWDGLAYRIMRKNLSDAKTIPELKNCGVYFLFGEQQSVHGGTVYDIYVGQAVTRKNGEGVLLRIKEHDNEKPEEKYWTEAIAFVDTKNVWGKTEVSYLENQFSKMVKDACGKGCKIRNKNEPSPGNVTKAKQWELNAYSNGAILILKTLGYKFFDCKTNTSPVVETKTPVVVKAKEEKKTKKVEIQEFSEGAYCKKCTAEVKKYYQQLKKGILKWEDVELKTTGVYIGFYTQKSLFASMSIHTSKIRVYINLKKGQLSDVHGITRDVSNIGHWGTGDYEVNVAGSIKYEIVMNLIWQAYQSKSQK